MLLDIKSIEKKLNRYINNNVTSLSDLTDRVNALVLECDLGNNAGLYLYLGKTKLILINSNLSDSKKKIVLAHELGHAILHTKSSCAFNLTDSTAKAEIEANICTHLIMLKLDIFMDPTFRISTGEFSKLDDGFLRLQGLIY